MRPTILFALFSFTALAADALQAPLLSLDEYNQRRVREALDKIPDRELDFRPTPEVRSIRELLGHIIDGHYRLCAQAKEEPYPDPNKHEKAGLDKAGLQKALEDSVAYCQPVYRAASGSRALALGVYHTGQHYGNLVTCMRLRGILPPGATQTVEKQPAANPGMTTYYFGLLKRGPNWTAPPTPELERLQQDHLAHLRKMHELGRLVVAGPLTDGGEARGILVFRGTETLEATRALAEQDPAVKAGRLVVELHPWMVQKGVLP